MDFDEETGVFRWTPSCLYSGTYRLVFTVTDDGNPSLSASQEAEVEVVDRCVEVEWTLNRGGSNCRSIGNGITVDLDGNPYVTAFQLDPTLGTSILIEGFTPEGETIWTETYWGFAGNGITMDLSGQIYVTGYALTAEEKENIWTRVYDSDGTELWTATYNGSANEDDRGNGIAVDSFGNVYVTGSEEAVSLLPNIWIRKYDPSGTELWTQIYDGQVRGGSGNGIAVDLSGNVYVAGYEVETFGAEVEDIWVRKYDSDGNALWTETCNGSNLEDYGYDIAVDLSGNVFVTGSKIVIPDGESIWLRKYDSNGSELWTETYYGSGGGSSRGRGIAVDADGNAYVTGYEATADEGQNIWVGKYDMDGNILWTESYNGSGGFDDWDYGNGVAVDDSGNVYVVGAEPGEEENSCISRKIWIRKYRNAPW